MNLDANTRLWIYRVAMAAMPLLVTLGLLTDGVAGQLLTIVGALLGLGTNALAANNVAEPIIIEWHETSEDDTAE